MTLNAPQLIFTGLLLVNSGICMARYGKQKTDSYGLADVLIAPAITVSLLWWGGFYG